jgi:hypothetical protein
LDQAHPPSSPKPVKDHEQVILSTLCSVCSPDKRIHSHS